LVSLGVSNRTAKKAKWMGGKLEKVDFDTVLLGFFPSFNRGLIRILWVYLGDIKI
jgi:hypothetical protein